MYTPKLFTNIKNSIQPLPLLMKLFVLVMGTIAVTGFVGLFYHQPILLIPAIVFAIGYETSA